MEGFGNPVCMNMLWELLESVESGYPLLHELHIQAEHMPIEHRPKILLLGECGALVMELLHN